MKPLLRSLYQKLILVRLTEEKIAEKYQERQMRCPVHLSIGQEAVAVGVCHNLRKNDLVYSTHRCHAHYLAKGGNLNKMIAEIYGKATGCTGGIGGSQHLFDQAAGFGGATPIVGETMPVAVGAALAGKLRDDGKIVTAFIGDGTVETGLFHESLNFAALKQLPILFVCENNFFSVYTHLSERQPARPIYQLARGHGIEASQHDGNNLLEVQRASAEAIKKIRGGGGPVFMEFLTYRYREHCGPFFDDQLGYRDPLEVEEWKKNDPVKLFEEYLIKNRLMSEGELDKIRKETVKKIDGAFTFAKKSPFPSRRFLYKNVYSI